MPFVSYKLLMSIKLLWTFYLLITAIVCKAQNVTTVIIKQPGKQFDNSSYTSYGHGAHITNNPMQQVDSIAKTSEFARHFCQVYSKLMGNVELQMQDVDSNAKEFIIKFEVSFADYFLKARADDINANLSTESPWKCFFSNPTAQPWQIVLLGVNAHTNADMMQVLVDNFSEKEIRQHKKQFLAMQTSVAKVYYQFFDTLRSHNSYLRFINSFTLGIAKKFGERIVYKWRKRSVNMAIMFYKDEEKFKRRLALVNKKRQKINQRILSHRS